MERQQALEIYYRLISISSQLSDVSRDAGRHTQDAAFKLYDVFKFTEKELQTGHAQ